MTNTTVHVISMTSSTDRRAAFAAAAQATRLDWAFFPALRAPAAPLVYDQDAALTHFGRPLKPGEIGCYASHFAVWQQFLASDADQLLVLEDDVIVDWRAVEQICSHDLARHGIHVLKLFATHPPRFRIAKYKLISDHSHLLRLFGSSFGTQAYLLTREGAVALSASCAAMTMPIDWAMSRYWDYEIENYAAFPFPVLEQHGVSTIEHAQQNAVSLSFTQKALRFSWRVRERLSRALFDLSNSKDSKFGAQHDRGAPYLANMAIAPTQHS